MKFKFRFGIKTLLLAMLVIALLIVLIQKWIVPSWAQQAIYERLEENCSSSRLEPVEDLPISKMKQLTTLGVNRNESGWLDLAPLLELPNLKVLNTEDAYIDDLPVLRKLEQRGVTGWYLEYEKRMEYNRQFRPSRVQPKTDAP